MTPSQAIKLILSLVVAAALGVAFVVGYNTWNDYQRLKDYEKKNQAIDAGTTAGIKEMGEQQGAQAAQEAAVYDYRGRSDRRYEELKREDQTVAGWAATRIPQRLLDEERAARASAAGSASGIDGPTDHPGRREGPGEAQDGSGADPQP